MPIAVSIDAEQIATVTLRNPARRNALDEEMFRELAALWPRLDQSDVRCVILTGEGDAFCSGADLSQDLARLPGIDALIDASLLKTRFFSRPIVAAINGACVAGGFELALSCDVRLCCDTARFGLPEVRWGIFPAGGGAMKLAAAIGHGRAAELLLGGELFGAAEALAMSFVGRVTSPGELAGAARETARRIAANSPAVVRALKRYMHAARAVPDELQCLERELAAALREGPDAAIGIAAFLGKKMPQYPG